MTFRLYQSSDAGTAAWFETQSATVEKGLFSVELGDNTSLDFSKFDERLYLGIEIESDGEMLPQKELTLTGYAVKAKSLVSALGESEQKPALSCADLIGQRPGLGNGIYWVKPTSSASAFRVYCDMTTEGGGWTLVWSNLRGGRGKSVTEIQWFTAINTTPLYRSDPGTNLEMFAVYTGLRHWMALAFNGLLRYDWSNDYNNPISERYICPFSLDPANNYTIAFTTGSCTQAIGTVVPDLVAFHNNRPFSTYDRDNDTNTGNCSLDFSLTPWRYTNCWRGSINGGGEWSGLGYLNGAYWVNNAIAWGDPSGQGAGNGWIFVK